VAKVTQGTQQQNHGIVVALYPSTLGVFRIELQRGASTSALARIAQLSQMQAGAPVLYQDVLPPTTTTYYYRARHTYHGFNPSTWTPLVSGTPDLLPAGPLPLEAEGRRRVDTLREVDAKLKPDVQQTDGARTLPVVKGWERGEVNGGWVGTSNGPASTSSWWDGPAVAFQGNYQSAPDVRLYAPSGLTFNEPDGANWSSTSAFSSTTRQVVQLHAVDVNAAGFTPRARLFQPSSTYKNAGVSFPSAGQPLTAVGESVAVDLTTNAPSRNDQYTEHYRVDLDVTSTKNIGSYTVTVEADSNTTGGWIERNSKSYDLALEETTGASFLAETMLLAFSGGTSSGDVRLKIKSFSVSGMSSGVCSYSVKGSTSLGVTWQYTTGGGIYTEMCPSTDDKVEWIAVSKEAST
jgi:hypothetical protein